MFPAGFADLAEFRVSQYCWWVRFLTQIAMEGQELVFHQPVCYRPGQRSEVSLVPVLKRSLESVGETSSRLSSLRTMLHLGVAIYPELFIITTTCNKFDFQPHHLQYIDNTQSRNGFGNFPRDAGSLYHVCPLRSHPNSN